MNIYRCMVHSQQVEQTRVKKNNRDSNTARSYDGCSSKGMLDIQDKPRFKERFSNHVLSKIPKNRDDRFFNQNPLKGRGTSSLKKKPTCGKCGKQHNGDCLFGTNCFFQCGNSEKKVRYFHNVNG